MTKSKADVGTVDFIHKGDPFSKVDIGIGRYNFSEGASFKKNGGTDR